MKILYIHQYFNTPSFGGATRSYWIGLELLRNGHEVTILTSTRYKDQRKYEEVDGLNVIYLHNPYDQKWSALRRILSFLRFMFRTSFNILRGPKYDLVIATSTPLTVGFPALLSKFFKRTPYLFEVRDLWPEVPIQMGVLRNSVFIGLTKWFEKAIYRNASHIVALSPGMYEGVVATGIPPEKVSTIPNMSKIDVFGPREKNKKLMHKLGISSSTFTVIYFGAMGHANAMDYIVDAAKLLLNEKDIKFLLVGYGALKEAVMKRCKKEGVQNISFNKGVAYKELAEIVNICDVSLVTFANFPILGTNSPNKFFDSLSAGKPIVVNSAGWTKDLVISHECGLFADPANPASLAEQILYLKSRPQLCLKMGANARKLAENVFDKSILCRQFSELVDTLSAPQPVQQ